MNRILVTRATGRTGRHVVSQLLTSDVGVRALVRNPGAANLPPQVEVARGDLTLPETLDEALDGIEAVYLVWSAPPGTVQAAVDRIAKHTRRIVLLSSPHQTQHPFFQAAQPNPIAALHAQIERSIAASGMAWTFLRPGMFAANALWWWAPQIRAGDLVRWPYALAPTAPIDERDIAAVAVRALSDERCAGAEYVLTGPQSLSHVEQVSTIGDVLGRSLRFEEISPEDWRRELSATEPMSVANMLLTAWSAAIGQPALVTATAVDVTGSPPRPFREWVVDHASEFRPLS